MAKNNKWSAFATPTKDELKALKKLIKVQPLLLSKSIVDDSEYRVYYNDENNNLQYLYVGNDALEKQKELIQSLKNAPDFKEMVQEMVKGYVEAAIGDLIKESISKEDLVGFIGADEADAPESFDDYKKSLTPKPNPNWDSTEEAFAKALWTKRNAINDTTSEAYKKADSDLTNFVKINIVGDSTDKKIEQVRTARAVYRNNYLISNNLSSQHNYYFDCGNGSTGSFACLWKKDSEYFILTAAHNLLKNGSIDTTSIYKLVSPENKYNETIYLKYDADGWGNLDWARLKITDNKGNSMSAVEVEKTAFYKNCIKFSNIQDNMQHEGRETDSTTTGSIIVGYNSCLNSVENKGQADYLLYDTTDSTLEKTEKFTKINKYFTVGGASGGCFFDTSSNLVGLYLGNIAKNDKSEIVGRIRLVK